MDPPNTPRPTRPRTPAGSEPLRAKSALGLRLLLSVVYTPLFLAGAGLLSWWAAQSRPGDSPGRTVLVVLAAVCLALALLAAADAARLTRRRRRTTA